MGWGQLVRPDKDAPPALLLDYYPQVLVFTERISRIVAARVFHEEVNLFTGGEYWFDGFVLGICPTGSFELGE